MQKSSKWSAEIGKPIFLEEFGMARNNWENKDKEYPYLSSASTSNKDAYFEVCYMMDSVMIPADHF
jgi:mannan endo-1,4-beta-mannosidase